MVPGLQAEASLTSPETIPAPVVAAGRSMGARSQYVLALFPALGQDSALHVNILSREASD